MPRNSKKGACSAHVESAKANCLKHNRREGKVPSYVNHHLTHDNRKVFEDEMIRDRKSILPLMRQAEKLYTEKTGQKCQKSFTPFREDVLVVKAGITDEQLMEYKTKVEALTGWKVIGIWLHQDEGHARSKYIEGDEEFKINYHAHVLYDCQDHQTGKAVRCTREYMRKRQDLLSEATGMERGYSAVETGRTHRKSMQQRIHSEEQRLIELMRKREEEEKKLAEEEKKRKELEKQNAQKKVQGDLLDLQNDKKRKEGLEIEKAIRKLTKEYKGLLDLLSNLKNSDEYREYRQIQDDRENAQRLLDVLIRNIDHARATAAAMGVDVSAKLRNTSEGWVLEATVGKTSLPSCVIEQTDAYSYKRGEMPAEILVAKYHPTLYQASPEKVLDYIKSEKKR